MPPPPPPLPRSLTLSLTPAETDLIPLIEEIALVVLRNRPSDINCFLANYLENRDLGLIPAPHITPDPAIAAVLARLHQNPQELAAGNEKGSKEISTYANIPAAKRSKPKQQLILKSREDTPVSPQNEAGPPVEKSSPPEPKPELKVEPKPEPKLEPKPELHLEPKPEPKLFATETNHQPGGIYYDSENCDNEQGNCKKAVENLVDEIYVLDSHVSRVQESMKSALRRSQDALNSLVIASGAGAGASSGASETRMERRRSAPTMCACPCNQISGDANLQRSQRLNGLKEPMFVKCWPNPYFVTAQFSILVGVLLGKIRIRDAPLHAAIVGWGLLAVLILLLNVLTETSH